MPIEQTTPQAHFLNFALDFLFFSFFYLGLLLQ